MCPSHAVPAEFKLEPVGSKVRYTLQELMCQCDLDADEPVDMSIWGAMRPVGAEYGAFDDCMDRNAGSNKR